MDIQIDWGNHVYDEDTNADSFGSHGGSVVTFNGSLTVCNYVSDNGSHVTVNELLTVNESFDVEGGSKVIASGGMVVLTDKIHVGNGSSVTVTGPLVINGVDMSMVSNWRSYVSVDLGSSFTWVPSQPACFLAGTMILMGDGTEKAVEDIKVGDMVRVFNPVRKS